MPKVITDSPMKPPIPKLEGMQLEAYRKHFKSLLPPNLQDRASIIERIDAACQEIYESGFQKGYAYGNSGPIHLEPMPLFSLTELREMERVRFVREMVIGLARAGKIVWDPLEQKKIEDAAHDFALITVREIPTPKSEFHA